MTAGWPALEPPAVADAGAAVMALPSFLPAGHRSVGTAVVLATDELEELQRQAEVLARPAQVGHAEAAADRERRAVGGLHDGYHPVQVTGAEGQRDRATAGLGRVSVAPVLRI